MGESSRVPSPDRHFALDEKADDISGYIRDFPFPTRSPVVPDGKIVMNVSFRLSPCSREAIHYEEESEPQPAGQRMAAEMGVGRSDIVYQVDQLILYASGSVLFRIGLDRHLIRAAMVLTFFAFSIQKWNQYTSDMLVPLIDHSPVVFWLLPAFGVRGAGYFLGASEMIFGTLIFLGYWSPRLGILGALGSIVTFVGTTTIIPFLPGVGPTGGWIPDHDLAGRFPDEGRPVSHRVILSAKAGCHTCGAGDSAGLSSPCTYGDPITASGALGDPDIRPAAGLDPHFADAYSELSGKLDKAWRAASRSTAVLPDRPAVAG